MKFIARLFLVLFFTCSMRHSSRAQLFDQKEKFTHQDTLRGSIGPGRDWWNVTRYEISVEPKYDKKLITGVNIISFKWLKASPTDGYMQIDLQEPMLIDSVIYQDKTLKFEKNGNAWFIQWPNRDHANEEKIKIYYHGNPRIADNPPWDGGWIFTKDDKGRPWMTVACQGLGASAWYPCKDHQSDEPDAGADLQVIVPDTLVAIGNGRLLEKREIGNGKTVYHWMVKNPINNYNIVPYIGKYVHFSDSYIGETKKTLSLDYWVLDYNLKKAKKQFGRDVKRMLKAFEYWFGPFPFYEDGYKLVESPHLGMEHQSAIAYGNQFEDGYLGSDISESGWGMKWDYIIIHESAHEWFSNNITTNDIADMWVHEGFAMYAEALFTEYYYGKKAADAYIQGVRSKIFNSKPVIAAYGVNEEGSTDMYYKGANLLHIIRQLIHNDTLFRKILRGLNKDFYHQTIDSKDLENYFSKQSGIDLSKIFDQYLRATKIPQLEYKTGSSKFSYRWTNCVPGFDMPVKLEGTGKWLYPTSQWKEAPLSTDIKSSGLLIDKNFYIKIKKAG